MMEVSLLLVLAIVVDFLIGDPVYRLHPVRIIGDAINLMERILFRLRFSGLFGGALLALLVESLFLGGYQGIRLLEGIPNFPGHIISFLINLFLVYSCIAVRDLQKHANAVVTALDENDLPKGQQAVQMIVGRDAKQLDREGVARAAIESVAESFVDGFLSPIFWFVISGVLFNLSGLNPVHGAVMGILAYRVINTLDSMVGYKNERYLYFGRFSAKVDDWLNLLPARLGIPLMTLAAFLGRFDAVRAWKIGWRDRLKHKSPNAGHTESCVAGALGIRLGGPVIYPFGKVEKPWMGDEIIPLSVCHLQETIRLMIIAVLCSTFVFAGTLLLVGMV